MAVKDMNYRDRGILLSMFAHQCYQEPDKLFEARDGIESLEPLKKFLNKPHPPTYIDVDGAQAYVMSDKDDVLVACRGTEPTQLNDIIADANFFPVRHHKAGWVHRGFYGEYNKVIDGIKDAIKKHDAKGTKTLWVCGHSLGGAMALLVAVELQPTGGCHTFGQPRVGTRDFLKLIDFPYYRYRNNNDAVTTVPPTFFNTLFKHSGVLRYINMEGHIKIATWGQRAVDKLKGLWYSAKKGQFFDGFIDHSMGKYHTYISNMDENGNQLPK